jgi:hypothetical protein
MSGCDRPAARKDFQPTPRAPVRQISHLVMSCEPEPSALGPGAEGPDLFLPDDIDNYMSLCQLMPGDKAQKKIKSHRVCDATYSPLQLVSSNSAEKP